MASLPNLLADLPGVEGSVGREWNGANLSIHLVALSQYSAPKFPLLPAGVMGCGAAEATGLGFICFINFTPPPPDKPAALHIAGVEGLVHRLGVHPAWLQAACSLPQPPSPSAYVFFFPTPSCGYSKYIVQRSCRMLDTLFFSHSNILHRVIFVFGLKRPKLNITDLVVSPSHALSSDIDSIAKALSPQRYALWLRGILIHTT